MSVAEALGDVVIVAVTETVGDALLPNESDALGAEDNDALKDGEAVTVADTETVELNDTDTVTLAVAVRDAVAVLDVDADTDAVLLNVGVFVGLGSTVPVLENDGVKDGVTDTVRDKDTVGVADMVTDAVVVSVAVDERVADGEALLEGGGETDGLGSIMVTTPPPNASRTFTKPVPHASCDTHTAGARRLVTKYGPLLSADM